ncbi:MAG: hypothetical protein WBB27_00360 [Maribacter sp.]
MRFSYTTFILLLFKGTLAIFSQTEKSAITISYPNQATIWTIPELVSLEWDTDNIGPEKSIRFFLVRNEMVVQELGSFKNKGDAKNITLAKNIGSGNSYQVVGIELFPDDKYNVAKYITPFFSIVNKASDERKKKRALTTVQEPTKKSRNKKKKESNGVKVTSVPQNTDSKNTGINEFEGRKISYTKELEFDSEDITVKIWDHGRQDGDIVSIYLNGNPVVSKYYLTYWKKEFQIKLNSNKSNDLFLYAHNLGDSPPNTVSVEITDGSKSENIILNSDLESCEAVMISVKK